MLKKLQDSDPNDEIFWFLIFCTLNRIFKSSMWCNGSTLHLGCRGDVRIIHIRFILVMMLVTF